MPIRRSKMSLYGRIIANSFKSALAFKIDFIISISFSFLSLALRMSIWQALYAAKNEGSINGIYLNDMAVYSIMSTFINSVVTSNVMNEINSMVLNGDITQRLLLPLGFRQHLFFSTLSNNVFWAIFKVLPPCFAAAFIYGFTFDFHISNMIVAICSIMLAVALHFCYSFVMGITVFWFKNSYFLDWMNGALFALFAGGFVPIWFFPQKLSNISKLLPFRYVIFEPTAVFLGKYNINQSLWVIAIQAVWILALWLFGNILWKKGQQLVFSQGG